MYLSLGVIMGLVLGIIPGIGGVAGTALLLPFTFDMDPYSAFALLLGLGAATNTGDPIPAVLFGVPGGAASAATVLDGFPMAKNGEAGRALSASYFSSMLGGLFGAALLGVSIPLLRPVMLYIGSPELLALALFGISMVAVLAGTAPLRGMTVACFGIMLAMIGSDPQTGTLRWTMNSLYLWDGLPLVPATLGLFALPELCDLAIARTAIAGTAKYDIKSGMVAGIKDCLRHWWLIIRCSWIGAGLGAVPGISGSVVDWLAYGHALKTERGASQTFGKGDVRGVIASESTNNAKEGGSLVTTVAFGVPGGAGMAILLGAFLIHGLVPGPDMLGKNLSVTYSMVWSIAIANIVGAGMCYLWSGWFAKLATLRYTLICPAVLSVIYIGAFEGSRQWGDLYFLLFFGYLGWIMKQLKWPRPPLILGLVLGDIIERYMFISVERYGLDWLQRPVVMVVLAMALLGFLRPVLQDVRSHGGLKNMLTDFGAPTFKLSNIFYVLFLGIMGYMLIEASRWNFDAKIVPMIVGSAGLVFCSVSLLNQIFRRPVQTKSLADVAMETVENKETKEVVQKIHMDLESDTAHIPPKTIALRSLVFFGWLVAFMASMATIGLIPTAPLFVILFMRLENKEPWRIVLPYAFCVVAFVYMVFDQLLTIPWPQTLVGTTFPAIKALGIPSL
ncbi:MAG: tripartite tricarboxylate transporter permease [Alphaproteobacteria bacterium]